MIKATYLMPHPPILIKEVGEGSEYVCKNTIESLNNISKEIARIKPKTILVITPHGPVFSDGIAIGSKEILKGSLSSFNHEEIKITKSNNLDLVNKIVFESGKIDVPCLKVDDESSEYYGISSDLDHGVIVPLHFIDSNYSDYNLVHITYGLFSSDKLYEFGMIIRKCIEELNEEVVIVASGDMSHKLLDSGPYEYHKSGPAFDKEIRKVLVEKDIKNTIFLDEKIRNEAGECGKRSIDIMLGTLDGYDYTVKEHSYEGPFGVGYLVTGFTDISKDNNRMYLKELNLYRKDLINEKKSLESDYVKLARRAIENYLNEDGKSIFDKSFDSEMFETRAGVFVSLKKDDALRGCIGTIGPTEDNIALEIVSNAIKAAFEDPRFPELEKEELESVTITVDILMEPEVIDDINLLDIKKYGVIVSTDYKRGLLLPNLDGIDSIEEQIRIAKHKGSIEEGEDFTIERFEVIRYY